MSQLDRLELAIEAYQKALTLKNNFFQAHLNLANCLRDRNNINSAIIHYRNVIELKPDFSLAYRNLTQALINLNLSEEVITICDSWLEQRT